ncbi:MAG TPA: ribosomal protein S18-alanine N-acetyltransferase [Mariprofundaceae bacterium]|nr:ribosomal protein S18-alanine N-acetyltransferase [Mariprofundaceae bacterium]
MARIRTGSLSDLEQVYRLNREVFPEAWSYDGLALALADDYLLLVAETAGEEGYNFAGYLLSHDVIDETHVMQVAVRPEFRRQGIARELTLALCALKSVDGIQTVLLEVRASNLPARHLYASLGFHEIGFRPRYYIPAPGQSEREDAILMSMPLGESPIRYQISR